MPSATSIMHEYRKEKGYDKYFFGKGIDIGCGSDVAKDFMDVFNNVESVTPYDVEQGDANYCADVLDETFDFVYSSHCLEHMIDPYVAFGNWLRVCKTGGYMVHCVPHEIFYEKCIWPSKYNKDHKTSWTLEWSSNMSKTVHVPDFLDYFSEKMEAISVETILRNFDFSRLQEDQTRESAICQIEFIGKKK